MGLGRFEQRMIASAKITSMERFGVTTTKDVQLVKKTLKDEIAIKDLGDGTIKIECADRDIKAEVKDYDQLKEKTQSNKNSGNNGSDKNPSKVKTKEIPPDKEREGEWISFWKVDDH